VGCKSVNSDSYTSQHWKKGKEVPLKPLRTIELASELEEPAKRKVGLPTDLQTKYRR
jgi:hypothetical protein